MEKLHVHVMNYRKEEKVYQATREQFADALARNPDLADRISMTVSLVERYSSKTWSAEELEEYYRAMSDADVLYGYTFPTEDIARYAPKLKWVQSNSAGVEQLAPFGWLDTGIVLTNSRGIHQEKSGESFAMYLGMLNAAVPRLFTQQCRGEWNQFFTSVIKGRTIVVLGVGSQGGEMAKQAKRMGMKVLGMDPYLKEHPYCDEIVPLERMEEVFRKTDYLALTAPLTKQTYRIVGAEQLGWLPHHANVINVSRGPLLDSEALSKKLHQGELAGAVLDVFDETPLPVDSPLWTTPNLFISPHVSSDDCIHYSPKCLDILMKNIRHHFEGQALENTVDTRREF